MARLRPCLFYGRSAHNPARPFRYVFDKGFPDTVPPAGNSDVGTDQAGVVHQVQFIGQPDGIPHIGEGSGYPAVYFVFGYVMATCLYPGRDPGVVQSGITEVKIEDMNPVAGRTGGGDKVDFWRCGNKRFRSRRSALPQLT